MTLRPEAPLARHAADSLTPTPGGRLVLEQFAELVRKEGFKMPVLIRTDKGHETELLKILALRLGCVCVCVRDRVSACRTHPSAASV